jgi:hypothetical protein
VPTLAAVHQRQDHAAGKKRKTKAKMLQAEKLSAIDKNAQAINVLLT